MNTTVNLLMSQSVTHDVKHFIIISSKTSRDVICGICWGSAAGCSAPALRRRSMRTAALTAHIWKSPSRTSINVSMSVARRPSWRRSTRP